MGTASWTDKTLIASGWYPPEAGTAEKRLRFYARQFPLVEVDSAKIRGLAADAAETHVVFNNCYRNYAQVNARQLTERLNA